MKLISFVAISFLAITVSAQAPQKYFYKSLRSSQSPQQFNQAERQEITDIKDKVDLIVDQLEEPDIDDDKKLELDRQYHAYKAEWTDLKVEYHRQYPDYTKARKKRDDAKAALDLLMENKERIKIYNGKDGVQTGLSPKSLYNLCFLKDQKNEILKKIKGLLEELEGIKDDKNGLSDGLTDRRDEVKGRIRSLQSQCKLAKKILREHKQRQSMGVQVRKFFNSHLPNTQL
ncbi:hypothetical protein BASA60_007158 [Batrachochytrium salamandrivorans]|nr:hypothetical protein BASA60_007158 [Batrachochytrium salamandrivorans]